MTDLDKKARQNLYKKKYYLKNKQKVKNEAMETKKRLKAELDSFKAYKGCYFCREKDFWCLEFHHVDAANKTDNLAKIISFCNRARIVAEVKKCIVVCKNCHMKLHASHRIHKKVFGGIV